MQGSPVGLQEVLFEVSIGALAEALAIQGFTHIHSAVPSEEAGDADGEIVLYRLSIF